jgi:hypothetical protein
MKTERVALCRSTIIDEENSVLFHFKTEARKPLRFGLDEVPEAILHMLALRGVRDLARQAYGSCADALSAYDETENFLDSLKLGILLDGRADHPHFLMAVAELRGKTVLEVSQIWVGLSDEQKTAIKANPQVLAIKKRLDAEKAAKAAGNASSKGDSALDLF